MVLISKTTAFSSCFYNISCKILRNQSYPLHFNRCWILRSAFFFSPLPFPTFYISFFQRNWLTITAHRVSEFAGAVGEPIVTMQHGITRGYSMRTHTHTHTLTHKCTGYISRRASVFLLFSLANTHSHTAHRGCQRRWFRGVLSKQRSLKKKKTNRKKKKSSLWWLCLFGVK